ncbi:MAG: GNAT family N-acetyltransferase [Coprobacillaceae bacterium]
MIETKRLRIREFVLEDAEVLSMYRNKEEVCQYQSWSHYPLIKAQKRIEYCLKYPFNGERGNYQVAVVLKDTDILIGDFFIEVHSPSTVILGYTFDSSYWTLGYASESLQAIMAYMKEVYNFKVALCYVLKDNIRSINLLKRNGFEEFEHSRYMGDIGFRRLLT